MGIKSLISSKINKYKFFSEDFIILFDTLASYFKKNGKYSVLTLEALVPWRNEGDLLSVLNEKNISYEYLPFILRFNEIYNNGDMTDDITTLLIPDQSELVRIFNTFRTKRVK